MISKDAIQTIEKILIEKDAELSCLKNKYYWFLKNTEMVLKENGLYPEEAMTKKGYVKAKLKDYQLKWDSEKQQPYEIPIDPKLIPKGAEFNKIYWIPLKTVQHKNYLWRQVNE